MKKSKLYIFTFLVIAVVSTLSSWGALHYFYTSARETLLDQKIQSGQREIRELGILLEQMLQAGIPSVDVINNLQQSILNTDFQSEFVCMYNTDGIELCHPDPSLVGTKIVANNSNFSESGVIQNFQEILKSGKQKTGIRTFPENVQRDSEIVSVYPVKGTDWMLASHANVKVLQDQLKQLYQQFLIGSLLLALILTGSCFWFIRLLYRKYEKKTELMIAGLNEKVNNLGILNRRLEIKQKSAVNQEVSREENMKKRFVTYQKDEIITIGTRDIAYIVLDENTVSTITFQDKAYTINSSLDDLMKQLDTNEFYRANRQYVVNVNAIESIWVYGRNQLRIQTKPKSTTPIIISKNKVSEFKKWLDR